VGGISPFKIYFGEPTFHFSERIMRHPLPDKFEVSRISFYAGLMDSTKHLKTFRAHMALHGTSDEIACKAFPLTLTKNAREWFEGLPSNSVNSL
jgi:hypothetical protein